MTQKYKKNNSPAIQNGIFSSFPDVSQPNLSDFPDVFWFRFKDLCQNLKNNSPEKILFLCEIWFTFVKHICESARFEKAPPLPLCTYILLRKRFASIFLKQKSPNF